jgi:hypothetical protein
MTQTCEDEIVPSEEFHVGRMEGRLGALEARVDRYEVILDRIDGKLDTLTSTLLGQQGRQVGKQEVMRWGITVVTAFGFVGTWLLTKFLGGAH